MRKIAFILVFICLLALPACNTSSETTVEVIDTTNPEIELVADKVTYYIGEEYNPMNYVLTVKDDSGEIIKAKYDDKNVDINTIGEYTITYIATDSSGNSTKKELSLTVKKEYTREEIKDIIQALIDDKYYNFNLFDQTEDIHEDTIKESLWGCIEVEGLFEEKVGDFPTYFWGTDTNVYSDARLIVTISTENCGQKNANTTTLNSELLLRIQEKSGETKVNSIESVALFSDEGKMQITSFFDAGSFLFNKDGYIRYSRNDFCFESEEQIEQFKSIISSTNVGIKFKSSNGDDKTFILKKSQCDNWIRVVQFYNDINEYVNNIPKEQ